MRWSGLLIVAFAGGLCAAASQTTLAPPARRAEPAAAASGERLSLMLFDAPGAAQETLEPSPPVPRRKPARSQDENTRLKRLRMFDIRGEAGATFRAGPRGTLILSRY